MRRPRTKDGAWPAIALVAVSVGCTGRGWDDYESRLDAGPLCWTHEACEPTETCIRHRCETRIVCTPVSPCPTGLFCLAERESCTECNAAAQCSSDEGCFDGMCRRVACADGCESIGMVCEPTSGLCLECVDHDDCPAEQWCDGAHHCVADECVAGETTCTGATIRTCSAAGHVASVRVCPSGACVGGACADPDAGALDAGP